MTYAERQQARKKLADERPAFKIRKGKKDITEYPDQAKPKSRQARFYDPDSPFGKNSLVYQLKTGKLREELKALESKDGGRSSDSAFQRSGPRPDLRPLPRRGDSSLRGSANTRSARRARDKMDVFDPVAELSRPAGSSRGTPRGGRDSFKDRDTPRRDRDATRRERGDFGDKDTSSRGRDAPRRDTDRGSRRASREDRDSFKDRDAPRRDTNRGSRATPREDRDVSKPNKDRDPVSVPYTTAASQFLYGRSVVEAALRSSRRKLYHLYVSGGDQRHSAAGDTVIITKLAERKQIPVTVVPPENARLMAKMADSRPHNGFILEASPLPQPPLTALGPLPEDYATNPVVPLELGHQSAEEAEINGTATSIPSPSASHKPLVVVLDKILDPGNLGNILRSVSFLGASAVAITRRGSADLTPVVLKASAGASETLHLFSITNLPEFLNASRANGWSTFAAVASGPNGAKQRRHMDLWDVQAQDPLRREPCVLIIGNEGEGLDRLTVKKADYEVNIPSLSGSTVVDSLNVGTAAALLCSAFLSGVSKDMAGFGGIGGENGEKGESLF
jgi:21S rRNA (GM2251-2'-O)-methyltransferase